MAMAASDIEAMIVAAIPDARVEIRDLVGDGLGGEPRCPLLDDESEHLVAVAVTRPDDGEVGERRVADPLLLAA